MAGSGNSISGFIPFDIFQKQVNEEYYSRKGRALYSDFYTLVQKCEKIAVANSMEFHYRLVSAKSKGALPKEIHVHEYGIGNGQFAFNFLNSMKYLDEIEKTDFYSRIIYTLGDTSQKLLDQAKNSKFGKAHSAHLHFQLLDAGAALPFKSNSVHYIKTNEMYDDLPSKILVRSETNGKLMEVFVKLGKGKTPLEKNYSEAKISSLPFAREAASLMSQIPEGYEVPINFGAAKNFQEINRILSRDNFSLMQFYDYGFLDLSEISATPKPFWNEFLAREYGGQYTMDVNFPFLSLAAKSLGFKFSAESISDYLARVFGQKFVQVDELLLSSSQLPKFSKKLLSKGFTQDFLKGQIFEEEPYFHATVSR
ncbi:Putative S-adenosyl-L-methionine-dependent methyltransferase [Candidatus Gugararchaeum adminiculabundum]|nr:Putative S-adenosyl-L-methionine-dependent methyltransferase [Candidatus Gugararchaeum adminiculabundum]